jgi:signal transduction histidine kinase
MTIDGSPEARSWWRSPTAFDLALSGGFIVVGVGEALFSDRFAGTSGWLVVLVAFQTVPLAVRRRWPLPVHLIVNAAFLAQVTFFWPGATTAASLVTLYTTGAELKWPGSLTAMGVTVFSIFYSVSSAPEWTGWNLAVALLEWSVVWALGISARFARISATEQRRDLDLLEHETAEIERQAAADERTRMARELHDAVGHSVSGMVLMASAANLSHDDEKLHEALVAIEDSGRTAMDELDRLVGMLRDIDDGSKRLPQPEFHQLETLIGNVEQLGLSVELSVTGTGPLPPTSIGRSTFRVVQESLSNALKYASPKQAEVSINLLRDQIMINVTNPINEEEVHDLRLGGARGLIGIRERARILGGTVDISQNDDRFMVNVRLPYHPN